MRAERIERETFKYKGYYIEYGIYGDSYTVQYCGDDVMFTTKAEAKKFIDEIKGE